MTQEQSLSSICILFMLVCVYYIGCLCYNLYESMTFDISGKIYIPDKSVICYYPHTSHFDELCVGWLLMKYNIRNIIVLAKSVHVHVWVIRLFISFLGDSGATVVEIDTSSGENTTHTGLNIIEKIEAIVGDNKNLVNRILIAPEGTRSFTSNIEPGFIGIAKKLNYPIVFMSLNYQTKTATISKPVQPDDYKNVMNQFRLCCSKSFGKYPSAACPILLKMEEYAI